MARSISFEDLWVHLEPLSDERIDAIYADARSDRRFWLFVAMEFVLYLVGIGLVSLLVPMLYTAFQPSLPFKLALAAIALAAIWLSTQFTIAQTRQAYYRAVLRQLNRGVAQDGS